MNPENIESQIQFWECNDVKWDHLKFASSYTLTRWLRLDHPRQGQGEGGDKIWSDWSERYLYQILSSDNTW